VRAIVLREWDPIGVATKDGWPEDEYDAFLPSGRRDRRTRNNGCVRTNFTDLDRMVFISREVALRGAAILIVGHGPDGEWFFLSGEDQAPEEVARAHLREVLERHPEVREFGGLERGSAMVRDPLDDTWIINDVNREHYDG
jgi:hypothetical protein